MAEAYPLGEARRQSWNTAAILNLPPVTTPAREPLCTNIATTSKFQTTAGTPGSEQGPALDLISVFWPKSWSWCSFPGLCFPGAGNPGPAAQESGGALLALAASSPACSCTTPRSVPLFNLLALWSLGPELSPFWAARSTSCRPGRRPHGGDRVDKARQIQTYRRQDIARWPRHQHYPNRSWTCLALQKICLRAGPG